MWIARNDNFGQTGYVVSFNKPDKVTTERGGLKGISFQDNTPPPMGLTYIIVHSPERFENQEQGIHLEPGEGPFEFKMEGIPTL